MSRNPRQQRAPADISEDILPNRLVSTPVVKDVPAAEDPLNRARSNPPTAPQRTATIRMVQASIDQIHGAQTNGPGRHPVDQSSLSSLNDHELTSVGDDERDRAIWGPPLSWPETKLEALAMKHAPSPSITSAHVFRYAKGRNNRIAVMRFEPSGEKCVIRTPACGWGSMWTENDKVTLEQSAETMRYLRGKTKIPIPKVIGYDVEISNTLGAPYIILEYIEGVNPLELWWGDSSTVDGDQTMERDNEWDSDDGESLFGGFYRKVSPDLEQKRQHILKSLAFGIAELRTLKFDKLGTFAPTNKDTPPTVEPTNLPCFGTQRYERFGRFNQRYKQRQNFKSSRAWLESCLDRYLDDIKSYPVRSQRARAADRLEEDLNFMNGLHRLYDLIVSELPLFDLEEQETFVIGHPNFGAQNILVDREGNVTGIVDWDHVETRPQYLGWNTPPVWLFPDFTSPRPDRYGRSERIMTPFELIRYQEDYARYLREACGTDSDGWEYSTKNYMLSMIVEVIASLDETKMTDTLIMILSSFMPAHIQFRSFIRQVGKPNQMDEEMEKYLKGQFRELLRTEEDHVAQRDRARIFDQPTSIHNSAAQESSTQMNFTRKNQQQGFLRPQTRRRIGDQKMNSPIPETQQQSSNNNHPTLAYPAQSNPTTPVSPTAAAIEILEPRPTMAGEWPIDENDQLLPENIDRQPTLTHPPATAIENLQPRPASAEMRMAGEWPVEANGQLLPDKMDCMPTLALDQSHLTTQVPSTVAENVRPMRNSSEVLRMAGAWPVDKSGKLLVEPVEARGCVIL